MINANIGELSVCRFSSFYFTMKKSLNLFCIQLVGRKNKKGNYTKSESIKRAHIEALIGISVSFFSHTNYNISNTSSTGGKISMNDCL